MPEFDLGQYSKHRTKLMGVAAILIILCHMPVMGIKMPYWLRIVLGNGNCGVDIFLFLSGIGMYNSYTKNKRLSKSIIYWFFKRYIRIIIPCALIFIPMTIIWSFKSHISIESLIISLSGFGFIINNDPLWFITCILCLYILTPLLDIICSTKHKWIFVSGLILACLAFSYHNIPTINKWQFMIQRWPSYLIGYAIARNVKSEKTGSIWVYIAAPLCLYITMFLANHLIGTNFSLFWLQGIPVITLCCLILQKLQQQWIHTILSFCGTISLESYVTNEYVLYSLFSISIIMPLREEWWIYIIGSIICLIVSYYTNKAAKIITNKIPVQ